MVKMVKRGKGQMELSFGMIFSIILIIIFLAFAFWAIEQFLNTGKSTQIVKFKNDLQTDVDRIWKGDIGSWTPESGYSLPKQIKYVCFMNFSDSNGARGNNKDLYSDLLQASNSGNFVNTVFYPYGSGAGLDYFELKHIDLNKMTVDDNPYCIQNNNGVVKLTVKKDSYTDTLVTIIKNG